MSKIKKATNLKSQTITKISLINIHAILKQLSFQIEICTGKL